MENIDNIKNSDRTFKIPEFEYFEMGGKYSGCKRGMNADDFNFRFTPKDSIKAEIWYDIKCFDKSELVASEEFELTREGYLKACDWVETQFQEWLKSHKLRGSHLGYFSDEE